MTRRRILLVEDDGDLRLEAVADRCEDGNRLEGLRGPARRSGTR